MVDRAGAVHEIPDDQVQAAFQSKKFGFIDGSTVPVVTEDGEMGRVDASEAGDAFASRARVAMPEEVKQAVRHEKYGDGLGNMAAAAAEGFGRGISFGTSDPLAIGAARAFGGEEAAEATREHLAGEKAEHGVIAGGSELLGMAAPLLVPGGAVVEGAEAAGRAAEAVGGAAKLGEGAAEAAKLGEAATPALEGAVTADAQAAAATGQALPDAAQAAAKAAEVSRSRQIGQAIGQGVRQAGFLPRGVAAAGELTEHVIGKIIGTEAGSTAGRVAQKIIAKAGGQAAEGVVFGLGDELDEEILGGEDINGEKLIASMGHGALLAGAAGGLLTGGGMLAREVVGRTTPYLQKLAGLQAWKAAVPGKWFSEAALKRVGGPAAVGATALEKGVLEGANTVEDIAANTSRILKTEGQALGEMYASVPAQHQAKLGEVLAPIDKEIEAITVEAKNAAGEVIKDAEGNIKRVAKPLHGKILSNLKQVRAEIIANLTPEIEAEVASKVTPKAKLATELTDEELATFKKAGAFESPQAMAEHGLEFNQKTLRPQRIAPAATEPVLDSDVVHGVAMDTPVPVAKLIEQRRAIGDMAYKEARALDPNLRVEHLRKIVYGLSELEVSTMDKAAAEMPHLAKAEVRKARMDYSRLSLYNDALEKSNARYATNNNFSLRDWGVGLAALAAGHPLGGVAATIATKFYRERGNAWSAKMLSKLSTLGTIERAASQVDRDIDRGLSGFFRPGERAAPRVRARTFSGPGEGGTKGEYEAHVNAVAKATAYADEHANHVERVADTISEHAPKTAASMQKATLDITSYMASQIPSGHAGPPNQLNPQESDQRRVSDVDKLKYVKKARIANDPVGTVFAQLNKGLLTKDDINTLNSLYPKIYEQMRRQAIDELAGHDKKLPFDKRIQIGILIGAPPEQAVEPMFVQSMQQNFQTPPEAPSGKPPSAPKRMLKDDSSKISTDF